jgi:hypothetical protein
MTKKYRLKTHEELIRLDGFISQTDKKYYQFRDNVLTDRMIRLSTNGRYVEIDFDSSKLDICIGYIWNRDWLVEYKYKNVIGGKIK